MNNLTKGVSVLLAISFVGCHFTTSFLILILTRANIKAMPMGLLQLMKWLSLGAWLSVPMNHGYINKELGVSTNYIEDLERFIVSLKLIAASLLNN
jgi:hypothetical protein